MFSRAPLQIALTGAAAALFGALALLVLLSPEILELDRAAILALRSADDSSVIAGPEWFGRLMQDVTALGGTPVLTLLTIALVGYLVVRRRWGAVGLLIAVVAGQALAVDILKGVFDRPRPGVVPLLAEVSSRSFPSGHAASSASVYLLLAAMLAPSLPGPAPRRYVFACAIVLALLVGMSRVALGVHYPTDVLGGWSFGVTWAAGWLLATRRLGVARTISPPTALRSTSDDRKGPQ